jgi:hypothetical protein
MKQRITYLVEFPEGITPGLHYGMKFDGGDVIAAQFNDAFAELEILDDALKSIRHQSSLADVIKICAEAKEAQIKVQ